LESAFEEKKNVFLTAIWVQEGLRGNDAITENLSLIKIAFKIELFRVNVVMN